MPYDLDAWAGDMRRRWAPLRDQAAFAVARGDATTGHHQDASMEVGGVFTAFVAAEYTRQVAAGALDPALPLELAPGARVDSSVVTEQLRDGAAIPLQDAAEAMVGASDNTATDLVMAAIGAERVRALLRELGLTATTIPDSTRAIYERVRDDPGWRPVACRTTMTDLARFYRATVAERALGDATGRFLALMREEDLLHGASWPDGATCYRKSGMIEPPPLLAMGMAGAFDVDGEVAAFAFALNVDFPEDAAWDDSPLEPIVRTFSEGMRHGLHALAAG